MEKNKLTILLVLLLTSCTFHHAKNINIELQQAYTNYYYSDSLQNIIGYYLPKLHYKIQFYNHSDDTIILPTSNYLEINANAVFYQIYYTDTLLLVQEGNSKNISIPPNSFKMRTFTVKNLKTNDKKENEILSYLKSVAKKPALGYIINPQTKSGINIKYSIGKKYKLNFRDSMNQSKMEFSRVPVINIDTIH